jgi:hypothetical protein
MKTEEESTGAREILDIAKPYYPEVRDKEWVSTQEFDSDVRWREAVRLLALVPLVVFLGYFGMCIGTSKNNPLSEMPSLILAFVCLLGVAVAFICFLRGAWRDFLSGAWQVLCFLVRCVAAMAIIGLGYAAIGGAWMILTRVFQ